MDGDGDGAFAVRHLGDYGNWATTTGDAGSTMPNWDLGHGATGSVNADTLLRGRSALRDSIVTGCRIPQDPITLIRAAIRGLPPITDHVLRTELRAQVTSGNAYTATATATDTAKPPTDWTDRDPRETPLNSRAKDAYALPAGLDGRALDEDATQALKIRLSGPSDRHRVHRNCGCDADQ